MTGPGQPCGHCQGTGRCDQPCCTTFGYRVAVPASHARTRDGIVTRQMIVRACAHCRGAGQKAPGGAERA